jgi:hypothetical protein
MYDDEIKFMPIHVQGTTHRIKTFMDDPLTIVEIKPFSLISPTRFACFPSFKVGNLLTLNPARFVLQPKQ